MIKNLIKLAVILIIGVLIYNYFLGTPEEKKTSQKIFGEMKDVAVGIKDLVKSEREKFDDGKYDKAVDEVGDLLSRLKSNAKDFDEKYVSRIDELEKKRQQLREDLSEYEAEQRRIETETSQGLTRKSGEEKDTSKIKKDLETLLQETQTLIEEMERGG